MNARRLLHVVGVVGLVLVVAPFVVFAVPQAVGADASYVVLSSSMAPAIHAGDVVVVADVPPEQVGEGDVVTFEPPPDHRVDADRVTHRVVDVAARDDGLYFETKGDANEEPDQALVPAENVVGVVQFHVPYAGYVVQFASSDSGVLVFVVVPAVLLVVNELYTLAQAAAAEDPEDD